MKRFQCRCGQTLFFNNTLCAACGSRLGFDPRALVLRTITWIGDSLWRDDEGNHIRLCRNALEHQVCNWLIPAGDADQYCTACRLTRTIPNLTAPENWQAWQRIEAAKRRLIYTLLELRLPVWAKTCDWPNGLAFDFIEDQRRNPLVRENYVMTGHEGGVITLNIAEADEVYRAMERKKMNESYRTLLGHFRHESGHYYFGHLIADDTTLTEFRALFGDERRDYDTALQGYYGQALNTDWQARHISAYATAHPLEDWAETWAHYLHMRDLLETAYSWDLAGTDAESPDFDVLLDLWRELSVKLNELNRSMGLRDAYPFVIHAAVAEKLRWVHQRLLAWRPDSDHPATAN